MNSVKTEYLIEKAFDDAVVITIILAIREVLATKCRYRAPSNIVFSVTGECVPELYPKTRHCSNKCYKCGKGKLFVKVR